MSCMVSTKASPGQRRTTNAFFLGLLGVLTEPKNTSFTAPPPEDVQGCSSLSQQAGGHHPQRGGSWGTGFILPPPLYWVFQPEEKRGWSAPKLWLPPGFISAVGTAGPGRRMGKTAATAKCKIQNTNVPLGPRGPPGEQPF